MSFDRHSRSLIGDLSRSIDDTNWTPGTIEAGVDISTLSLFRTRCKPPGHHKHCESMHTAHRETERNDWQSHLWQEQVERRQERSLFGREGTTNHLTISIRRCRSLWLVTATRAVTACQHLDWILHELPYPAFLPRSPATSLGWQPSKRSRERELHPGTRTLIRITY